VKPVIYGSLAAFVAGVPRRFAMVAGLGYVYTPEDSKPRLARRLLSSVVTRLYRVALRTCHLAFFQNEDDVAHFIEAGMIDPAKVRRINGSGVDLEHFAPVPPVTTPVTFLLAARLLKEKGIFEFVDAARAIRRSNADVRFVVLGEVDVNPGSLTRSQLESWVSEGVIEWPGQVDDVRPWIAESSVYVLPSYREGLPRSSQEAMAMGRPIITTDTAGCRETVVEGVNGYLVPLRDSGALAAAMQRFVDNPAAIESMGRESRRLAEERFDVHAINAVILGCIGLTP
jgi:glycosyltransferase involved in cell wall biosynthesis